LYQAVVSEHVCFWQIVLKKSDFTSDQNFAEAPAHSSENDVGDRITDPISNGKPPQALCKALNYQSLVSTGVPRNFAVISFLSFSTLSALSGHSRHRNNLVAIGPKRT